jgi:cytochrome P450
MAYFNVTRTWIAVEADNEAAAAMATEGTPADDIEVDLIDVSGPEHRALMRRLSLAFTRRAIEQADQGHDDMAETMHLFARIAAEEARNMDTDPG